MILVVLPGLRNHLRENDSLTDALFALLCTR
jgi:hypothetical protein